MTCTNTMLNTLSFWFREIGFRAKFQRFYAELYYRCTRVDNENVGIGKDLRLSIDSIQI